MTKEKQEILEKNGWQVGSADEFLMKPLPNSFFKWGYEWSILKRTEDWALLSQSKDKGVNYNVCKIKKAKAYTFPNGITIPPQEAIPSAEEWGRVAWNFCKLENAEKKYNELTNESSS